MRIRQLLFAPVLLSAAAASAAAPVEVTRFHTPQTLAQLGPGAVEVVAAPGLDAQSLETRAMLDAVARELSAQGLSAQGVASAARIAEVRLTRDAVEGGDYGRGGGSSVSVGVSGGSGGGWYGRRGGTHVGVGVGIGFPVGGGGSRGGEVDSELSVTIRDKASGAPLWEGRSNLRTSRRAADDPETAEKLAHALFSGFPGQSGATIEVE
ncbi:MAG: DUF4136 domain-containing protein [Novosphingobium sp.]|nr:DUF4136 domain-containing protein [Novosphingobium sp.]